MTEEIIDVCSAMLFIGRLGEQVSLVDHIGDAIDDVDLERKAGKNS